MMRVVACTLWLAAMIAFIPVNSAQASLRYSLKSQGDLSIVFVEGDFTTSDNLNEFAAFVQLHHPSAVVFNSPGGQVTKAIEFGRMVRSLNLNTIQIRSLECASACALAFLGGVLRYAEPGSIGVHKSSFSDTTGMSVNDAVSAVQQLTAHVVAYMVQMGVDPSLLELSLSYESNDIRYLSQSEMERYKVVTTAGQSDLTAQQAPVPSNPGNPTSMPPAGPPPTSQPPVGYPSPSRSYASPSSQFAPVARSGRVLHPSGQASLKLMPDGKSGSLTNLGNGTSVAILDSVDRWYRVTALGQTGYMHDTWIRVDQYDSGPFDKRHIQVKSFDNQADAVAFARASSVPLSAYLATNGWFAVAFKETYSRQDAIEIVKWLKAKGSIPDDAFVTNGNTYMRKVCCG